MSYGVFAEFYDRLTANVNYPGYARRVDFLIRRFLPSAKSVAELACGTANLGFELERLGYGVIGVDISKPMLDQAEKKISERGSNISLFQQDIRALRLENQVDAAVCSLDALNHLGGLGDIKKAFLSVRNSLNNGGLFIFDMNTPYKHEKILGDNTFVYELPEVYTVWKNEYRPEDISVGITLDFFVKTENGFDRHTESFCERAYKKEIITSALSSCGFETLGTYDELKSCSPSPRTERILYIARRV